MNNTIEKIKEYGAITPESVKRADKAREAFLTGYNCTQSLLIAFADSIGINDSMLKAAQPLGGGLSRLREVCGAVSGGALVLGASFGSANPKDHEAKSAVYKKTQLFGKRFEELNGSVVCRELLGLSERHSDSSPEKRSASYYAKRPCSELVWLASLLVSQIIEEEKEA